MKNQNENQLFVQSLCSLLKTIDKDINGYYRVPIGKLRNMMMQKMNIVVIDDMEKLFRKYENRLFRIVDREIGLPSYGAGLTYDPQHRVYIIELLFCSI